MKTILLALGFTMFAAPAFANDGSIPYIKVKSVAKKTNGNIVIKGSEAFKLYSVLPRDYVYDVSRFLMITSDQKSVSISCRTEALAGSDENNPTPDPAKVECEIQMGKAFNPSGEGDTQVWEPKICPQN